MKIHSRLLSTLFAFVSPLALAAPLDPVALDEFIESMHRDHGFESAELQKLFAQTKRSDKILDLMTRPAEKVKPWWEYRDLFISTKRIRDGAAFWKRNEAALQRALSDYGVPAHIIVAIIGVETSYGRITGNHRVVEALATLAFHYPGDNAGRAKYFRNQLEHFLLFTRENELEPLTVKGSYAGAMGMPQFMPDNYRRLAVDYDGDGVRDIWRNPSDAIGSVANYLNHHGWLRDGPVMSPARLNSPVPQDLVQSNIKPRSTLRALSAAGILPLVRNADLDTAAGLFELEAREGNEYWIGYTNFYVTSLYNPRLKYTMAVAQLAQAIRDLRYQRSP